MQGQYNMRSPAVKRLMKEAHELKDPTELYYAQPLEDNLFEWHFTLRGPEDSDFDGGIYHGRIVLPPDYPMKPPSIILLTPNGRFETNKKICLSISGHHPESWQPSWSIRTALLAIIGFMPTHGGGAIGSLDYTPEERKVLAKRSQDWKCSDCGDLSCKLKPLTAASEKASKEAKELAAQINFSGEKTIKSDTSGSDEPKSTPNSTAATAAPGSGKDTAGAFRPLLPGAQFPWPVPPGWPLAGTNNCLGAVPRFPYPPYCMPPNFAASNSQRGTSSGAQQMPFFPPAPFFPPFLGGMPPFPPTHCAQASHPQTPGASQTSQVDQPAPSTSVSLPSHHILLDTTVGFFPITRR
ncbi:hypothetical protein C0Q70_11878 [Pomacea canaliculata]|uniref:UBC core domain-containing protein n=2 Tax=Pomacea canaliculata TaxID=400727 RepID=A0A2T7P796_POMCA|nr:hypothetical protein C0Q70_11878 [Pomacea canaliculata]